MQKNTSPSAIRSESIKWRDLVEKVANEVEIDAHLLHAMVAIESRYKHEAVSPKGALGLMQVMPTTGKRFGFTDLTLPYNNLSAGATYMKWLLEHFEYNLELALAGYNAGEGAVAKYGKAVPPYPETQKYVAKVMSLYGKSHPSFSPAPTKELRLPLTESNTKNWEIAAQLIGLLISPPK
ncbi:lytic transglycosylase domain-containing protein [Pseudomonas chlororaphis subsp. aurantiaca]|nr:lytic transglycosylase domain-containing protein [Pseudomonas chlororaphis subsp. aurantiaca]